MSIKAIHAKMNEKKTTTGGLPGDQTGKEIFSEPFYLNDSKYLLICRDKDMAARALAFAIEIANNDAFGYSQDKDERWSGFKSIMANGGRVDGASGSFDCASFIITVYILAGLKIKPDGYTGSMRSQFKATGMFDIYQGSPYTTSSDYAKAGCLYLRPKTSTRGGHVFMAMQDGSNTASDEDNEGTDTPESADGQPVVMRIRVDEIKEWCNVRNSPVIAKDNIIGHAYKNDEYDVLGVEDEWYRINYKGRVAYIYYNLVSEIMEGNV